MSVVDHGSQGIVKFVVVVLAVMACLYFYFGYLPK